MPYTSFGLRPVGVRFRITSPFNAKRPELSKKLGSKPTHKGIDFGCPVGTDVYAYADGKVQLAGLAEGFGNRIWIYHDVPDQKKAYRSCYAHLTEILVKPGEKIKQGDVIAKSGGKPGHPGSGRSTGPHLHFETRYLPEDSPYEPFFIDKDPENESA